MLAKPLVPILNGEELFKKYYVEMGTARSVGKILKQLKKDGVVHPATGRCVTSKAVQDSMWSWAIRNEEEAYKIVNEAAYNEGDFWTREYFEGVLQKHVWRMTKASRDDRRFYKWLAKRGKEKVEWQSLKRNVNLTSTS